MDKTLENPFKTHLDLKRYPHQKRELLQAWDSADELILQYLGEQYLGETGLEDKKILILNDSFGALSCALEDFNITVYTDSYVSFKGTQLNSRNRVTPLHRIADLSGPYDLVLIRVPKNMSFFEDLLCHLSGNLHSGSKIICGYMVKHQANASFELLNRYIGPTTTSLARKKARLIFADFQRGPVPSPYPLQVALDSFEIPFVNHSNLFSREKLDIGTRFLLDHLPQGNFATILDLGCANGIVGIAAKRLNPAAKMIFSDDSNMAVQSAQTNYRSFFQTPEAEFLWTNCFENQTPGTVDLVICNPPFHQGNTQGDFIAWQMFTDSHRALAAGGTLRVIGNSNLHHPAVLQRIFGNSTVVAKNSKFTIVDAFN